MGQQDSTAQVACGTTYQYLGTLEYLTGLSWSCTTAKHGYFYGIVDYCIIEFSSLPYNYYIMFATVANRPCDVAIQAETVEWGS